MSKPLVYVGVPTHDGRVHEGTMVGLFYASRSASWGGLHVQSQSWLQRNFNAIFASALNNRSEGITHFCLLHSDVGPTDPDWLDKLLRISEERGADIVSAVVPIKSSHGVTSTAIDAYGERFVVKRLTLHEIYGKREATFTDEKLLLNTGCFLVDIRKPWVETLDAEGTLAARFEFVDRIIKLPNGKYREVGMSEDWQFSRIAASLGATNQWATTEVHVVHHGGGAFGNEKGWGTVAEEIYQPQVAAATTTNGKGTE